MVNLSKVLLASLTLAVFSGCNGSDESDLSADAATAGESGSSSSAEGINTALIGKWRYVAYYCGASYIQAPANIYYEWKNDYTLTESAINSGCSTVEPVAVYSYEATDTDITYQQTKMSSTCTSVVPVNFAAPVFNYPIKFLTPTVLQMDTVSCGGGNLRQMIFHKI